MREPLIISLFKVMTEGVEELGYDAFSHCSNLKTVTLPKSLKKICDSAFRYCTGLEKIIFNGSKADWSLIEKASNWRDYASNFVIECTVKDSYII